MTDRYERIRAALTHEIWAVAQLAPGEGIVDGVARIASLLRREAHPAITHCDNCGCDWLDNGLNPIGCPYCKLSAETEALRESLAALKAENEMLRKVLKDTDNELDWLDEEVGTCDHSVGACHALEGCEQRDEALPQAGRSTSPQMEWFDGTATYEPQ